jgi:hypothetical protein
MLQAPVFCQGMRHQDTKALIPFLADASRIVSDGVTLMVAGGGKQRQVC